jgi:hypothetical protein
VKERPGEGVSEDQDVDNPEYIFRQIIDFEQIGKSLKLLCKDRVSRRKEGGKDCDDRQGNGDPSDDRPGLGAARPTGGRLSRS